jgi:hypothetical protein
MELHFSRKVTTVILASLLAAGGVCRLRAQATPNDSEQSDSRAHTKSSAPEGAAHEHEHDGSMPGMNMQDDPGNHAQAGAMQSMAHGHHMGMDGAHMLMTPVRPTTADDRRRADEIADALAKAIQRYKDYRVALADGFHIFAPNLPQPQYHFTNYWNGYLEGFTFDPARPTSLLYKKTKDGYELIGAMYTAPRTATLEELNERIPLGIARWHQHTNLCLPKRGGAVRADWKKFGLTGSISTEQECQEAGGRFYPVIFGWMVHVYPFESSPDRVWAQ